MKLLKDKGLEEKNIKIAFDTIRRYKLDESPKDIEKKSKFRADSMLKTKSISTYIIRETLSFMMDKRRKEDCAQMHLHNSAVYIEACTKFIREADEVISGSIIKS
jgi:hypothetical protein